jgi:hypothetical protein
MNHLLTFPLFESYNYIEDQASELHNALFNTPVGKSLLDVTSHRFRDRAKTQSAFTMEEFSELSKKFAVVIPTPAKAHSWTWQIHPFDAHNYNYYSGGDFSSAEECLRSLYAEIVPALCQDIFLDPYVRKAHSDLTREHIDLFIGDAHSVEDLTYLIIHLGRILSGNIDHSIASVLREKFPKSWQEVLKKIDPDSGVVSADLGDLGF